MTNEKPFFSIIIPTLNEEQYLPRLLVCIQKQSFSNFEVIVVDGKSSDGTVAVAQSFDEKIPSLTILNSDNQNVGLQRNLGAERSKGEYLVFFDADVQIPKNFLRKIFDAIVKYHYMFLCAYLKPDTMQAKDWILVTVSNIGMEVGILMDRPFVGGFDIIIHQSVFKQIGGFNTKLVLAEDHDLAQRCLSAGIHMKILHTPRLVVSLRRFRREGYFVLLRRYTHAQLYYILRGPIKKVLFDYPMGGHIYNKEKEVSSRTVIRFERWLLKSVRQIIGV